LSKFMTKNFLSTGLTNYILLTRIVV